MGTLETVNKTSILFLAREKRKAMEKFELFSMASAKLKSNLPDWLMETIKLIPPNSLIRNYERKLKYPYFWEDFLNTLFLSKGEVFFYLNQRVQLTPFGIHHKVGLDDQIPDRSIFEATANLFFEMVGKRFIFTQEEGYLIISFLD